jgi:hypothetical protein
MSGPKKPFALRLSAEMMSALEKWAQDEFRSTNGQIEYLLHESLRKSGRLKPDSPPEKPEKKDNSDS